MYEHPESIRFRGIGKPVLHRRICRRCFAAAMLLSSKNVWTIYSLSYNVAILATKHQADILPYKILVRYSDQRYTCYCLGVRRIFCKHADDNFREYPTNSHPIGRQDNVRKIYWGHRAAIPQICRRQDIVRIYDSTSRVVSSNYYKNLTSLDECIYV